MINEETIYEYRLGMPMEWACHGLGFGHAMGMPWACPWHGLGHGHEHGQIDSSHITL
jgi:hypothetical protein